jgi:heme exporter protein B
VPPAESKDAPSGSGSLPRNGDASSRILLSQVLCLVGKDLRLEWRSREILYTMSFFAVLVIVIFAFALAGQGVPLNRLAGGVLWLVIAFAGTLGLGRMFDREREGDTHLALLLSPANRSALFLGKLLGVFFFICLTEAVVIPLLFLLFDLRIASIGLFFGLLFLGTLGFSAVGSLFAAALWQSRSRDVLLGILLLPIVLPVVIAGAKGTGALLAGPTEVAAATFWLKLMLVFDVVFVTLSLWIFEPLTRGE